MFYRVEAGGFDLGSCRSCEFDLLKSIFFLKVVVPPNCHKATAFLHATLFFAPIISFVFYIGVELASNVVSPRCTGT